MRWPVTDGSTRHVDYRECRIDLSGGFSDLPAIHQTLEVYVCDECSVIRDLALEQGHGFFGRCGNRGFEAGIYQRFVNDGLYCKIILDYEANGVPYLPLVPARSKFHA